MFRLLIGLVPMGKTYLDTGRCLFAMFESNDYTLKKY